MGHSTTASDYASLSIGEYNSVNSTVTTAGSGTTFDTDNAALVIGNGTSSSAKSDAFVVYNNGNATLSGNLTVDGTIIGAGKLKSVTESSNTGVRLSTAVAANHGDIGSNAVDLSYSSSSSTTVGATGATSTAMGSSTTASGGVSTAIGFSTTASGGVSTAMGHTTTAFGMASTAMGAGTTASGQASTAMGDLTTASGGTSTAMGYSTTASDYASLTIGQYNSVNSTVTGSATAFNTANAALVIGKGTGSSAKSDAFVVYFNGNATLSGDLTINSDERLKENIQPLGSTLDKLHQIEGKTYSLKKDEKHTPKIGVLAQEVQAVFPELVTEGGDGILSVNYQGLVPVLINAINEQEVKIAALEAQNEQLSIAFKKIATLEAQNTEIKEMVRLLALKQSKTSSTAAAN
jgi:hypothetical protein